MTGDEDFSCLEPALLLKRAILTSAFVVVPNTGHTINLEEPELFNRILPTFCKASTAVPGGRAIRARWRRQFWGNDWGRRVFPRCGARNSDTKH
jgi:hypothetical protein